MAQSASKVDETDTEAWLRENRRARICRARRHRWPDPPEDDVTKPGHVVGEWELITDAARGEPNCRLVVECERGCGTTAHRLAVANFKKQTVYFVSGYLRYDDSYRLHGGVRITPKEAEAAILLDQLQPLARAARPKPTPRAASAKPKPALRAVS